jgi:hypothetical protein
LLEEQQQVIGEGVVIKRRVLVNLISGAFTAMLKVMVIATVTMTRVVQALISLSSII